MVCTLRATGEGPATREPSGLELGEGPGLHVSSCPEQARRGGSSKLNEGSPREDSFPSDLLVFASTCDEKAASVYAT